LGFRVRERVRTEARRHSGHRRRGRINHEPHEKARKEVQGL